MGKTRNPKFNKFVTIFFGWSGAHRFMAGQPGIGILYLLTFGLFALGWLFDVFSAVRTQAGKASPSRSRPKGKETFDFITRGAMPEKDHKGRVVVRLSAGSSVEIPTHFIDGHDENAAIKYFQGGSRGEDGDEGEKTVRMRLVPILETYWGGTCFYMETPSGVPLLEARSYFAEPFALLEKVIKECSTVLPKAHTELQGVNFVFDVPVRLSYTWFDDETETSGTPEMDIDHAVIRLRDPLEVEIKGMVNSASQ
jgi:hypothetical protein